MTSFIIATANFVELQLAFKLYLKEIFPGSDRSSNGTSDFKTPNGLQHVEVKPIRLLDSSRST